jgi:predicted ATPase
VLAEELHAEPAPETAALYEQIQDSTLTPSLPSPEQHRPGPTHNLPLTSGPFVGREAELTAIQDYLQDPACRLLTLVGAGGMGKTRLALEAVFDWISRLQESELEGVTLVSLAPLQTVGAIVPAIAQAIGILLSPGHDPGQQLLDYLAQKRWLLILDSFEHLPDGAGFIAEILRAAPDVKILVTSRTRPNLRSEHCFPVAGIEFPERFPNDVQRARSFAAVNLFLQAAHRVRPRFEPDDVDLAAVSRICRLVQGMPLGILLAAAWSAVLSPAEIAAEIQRGLDFLEADWVDVPERQRSIRAVFDRSWTLLSDREREVFQALSVFAGGFTRDPAEHVTGTSLQELKVLVDRSLLHRTPAGRYEFHELVRQYAAGKLDGSPATREAIRNRHSAYYAAALHQWETELKGPRQQAALANMDADSENIRAAWEWAVEHDQVERLAISVGGLALFYWLIGRYEEGEAALRAVTRSLATRAIGLPTLSGDSLRLQMIAMVERSNFCRKLGRKDQVARLHQQALALLEISEMEGLDTRSERARLLQSMGHFVLMSDYEQGRQLQEKALVLFRELDEQWWMADALHDLGRAALFTCSVAEARGRFEESLALYEGLGIPLGIAQSMAGLSMVAVHEGRLAEAELHARQAVSRFREHCVPSDLTYGLDVLGIALEAAGEFDDALSPLEECLAIHLDLGQRHYSAYPRAALGRVNLHLGRYAEARAHAQIGLVIARETGLRFAEGDMHFVLGSLALIQGVHADAHAFLSESASIYAQLGDQASLSRSHALLAWTARGSGPPGSVREHLVESLKHTVAGRSFLSFLWALPAVGLYLLDEGQAERALELHALASCYPFVSNSFWFQDMVGREVSDVVAALPHDALADIEERGRVQDLEATASELLAELER